MLLFFNKSICSLGISTKSKISYKKAASLLPKLRDKFAEFLQHGSLKRLRLLDVFTSVGLQYGEYKFQKKELILGFKQFNSTKSKKRLKNTTN